MLKRRSDAIYLTEMGAFIARRIRHEANMSGDKIDHGGCVNTLTTLRPSPLAKGNPQHTNLVEIEKI